MNIILKLSVSDNVTSEKVDDPINKTIEVLTKRLEDFDCNDFSIEKANEPYILNIEFKGISNPEQARAIVQTTAKLEFWETYEYKDVYGFMEEANGLLVKIIKKDENIYDSSAATSGEADTIYKTENPLFSILSPSLVQDESGNYYPAKGPVAGYAALKDTARINYMLNTRGVKNILPDDLKFLWYVNTYEYETTAVQLICIRVSGQTRKAALEGDMIVEARAERDPSGSIEIFLEMNKEGSSIWKRLTSANINKSIAIVIDDNVYAFPTVVSEIENGKSSITGNFSLEEATTMALLIKHGALPVKTSIIDEKVIQNK